MPVSIDAEGRDLDVVHGALSTMARAQPAEIFPAVRQLGYTPYLFKGHTGAVRSMVDYEVLSKIYDLAGAKRDANHCDMLLWSPRMRPRIKPYAAPS